MVFRDTITGEYPLFWTDLIARSDLDDDTRRAAWAELDLSMLPMLNAEPVGKSSPPYNAPWQQVIEAAPVATAEGWVQGWHVENLPGVDPDTALAQAKDELAKRIAAQRYEREVGGINIGGIAIRTDRESQAQVNSAYSSLKNGLINRTQFKGADGWVTVTLAEMEPIARAVATHVAACFDRECLEATRLAEWDGTAPFAVNPV